MDPTQTDQILVNLCVNARDAIAGVGKITIQTKNAVFGEASEPIEGIDKKLEGDKVEKKAQLETYKSILGEVIKQYEAEESKIDEDDELAKAVKFKELMDAAAAKAEKEVDEALVELNKSKKPKVRYWDRKKRRAHYGDSYPYALRPLVSPDGKKLAMVHLQNGNYRIAVMDLERKDVLVLSAGRQDESASFAPNSDTLIYATRTGSNGVLESVTADGLIRQRLKSGDGDVREPVWSPFQRF